MTEPIPPVVLDAVDAELAANPDLGARLQSLTPELVAAVQTQLTAPPPETTQPPAGLSSEDLLTALRDHVRTEFGATALDKYTDSDLRGVARRGAGRPLEAALRSPGYAMLARTLESKREKRAPRTGLSALTGVENATLLKGHVEMDQLDYSTAGSAKPVLYTTGLGGCIGIAVFNGSMAFVAHYDPLQLGHDGAAAAGQVRSLAGRMPLGGARCVLSSPAISSSHGQHLKRLLLEQGVLLEGEHTSPTLAIDLTTGTFHHGFEPPPLEYRI